MKETWLAIENVSSWNVLILISSLVEKSIVKLNINVMQSNISTLFNWKI